MTKRATVAAPAPASVIAAAASRSSLVERFNAQYAVIQVGGKVYVLQERPARPYELLSVEHFRLLHKPETFTYRGTDGPVTRPATDIWLGDRRRRFLKGGIVFEPPDVTDPTPNAYNLWRGFAVEPKPGCWSRLSDHIAWIVCQGNDLHHQWLLDWFAWLLRHPSRKVGTAVALRGVQGSGKSVVGEAVGHVLGTRHYAQVASSRYITGRFNSHLEQLLLLQGDEAFYAGDPAAEAALKDLITGTTMMIERKGVEPYQMPNYVRLFVTGNHDWIVPAGIKERRFAVFDVVDAKVGDAKYFDALHAELESGGYQAMLHDLLGRTPDEAALRRIPDTAALRDQQARSLPSDLAWLASLLNGGTLPDDVGGRGVNPNAATYEHYLQYVRSHGHRGALSEDALGHLLRKYVPAFDRTQLRDGERRVPARKWPFLAEARTTFARLTSRADEWDGSSEWAPWTCGLLSSPARLQYSGDDTVTVDDT